MLSQAFNTVGINRNHHLASQNLQKYFINTVLGHQSTLMVFSVICGRATFLGDSTFMYSILAIIYFSLMK